MSLRREKGGMLADRRRNGGDARFLSRRANTIWRASSSAPSNGKSSSIRAASAPGDALLALPSSGLHTNGYSLARKLVFEVAKLEPDILRSRSRQQDRRRTAQAASRLLAAAEKYSRARLGHLHGAYHRRRHHRKFAASATAQRACGCRSGLLAGAADFSLSRAPRLGSSATNSCRPSIWAWA